MKFQYTLLFSLLILWLPSCIQNETQHVDRPIDPWVFRSVLDKRPRMITIALHNDLYAAFDASRCGIHKIWKGGINIHGAPFDGIKTVQPTSWGHAYGVDSLRHQSWILMVEQEEKPLKASFKGYQFINNQVYFNYTLINSTDTIGVQEKVEFLENKDGKQGLERNFSYTNLPENATLLLKSMGERYEINGNSGGTIQQLFDVVDNVQKPEEQNSMGNRGFYWLEKSGCGTCHEHSEKTVGPGYIQIAEKYDRSKETITQLIRKVQNGGSGVWGEVPMIPHPQLSEKDLRAMITYIFSLKPESERKKKKTSSPKEVVKATPKEQIKPGFGAPLEDVHPSYDLSTIRPQSFKPRVAAMDFLSDGSLLISTWDSIGAVYRLRGVETGDTNQVSIKRIASGLAEPLGMKVVDDKIFVQQKHELTQLIDHDGDEVIDEYKAISNSFGVTADFHEFALGLEYKDGYFYTNLSLAMRLMAHERQLNDRGRTIKIAPDNGSFSHVNFGLRQPNGLGIGIDGELFTTENQGRWNPANKFIHIQEGVFHGNRLAIKDSLPGDMGKPPAVWLPQDEIGNSPSQPLPINDGPYAGQMIHGEVTHGGVKRVFLEKIEGEYQGCVFRFIQGLEAGINRMTWGPDSALYVGGVGMSGTWAWNAKTYGLQRLKYNGKSTFEMLAVRAKADGMEIEFTEPVNEDNGINPSDFVVQQWWYLPTERYGGPKKDLETLAIKEVKKSADGRKVYLIIPGLKKEYVVYIRLKDDLTSKDNQPLWTSECWYTLNHIPES